MTGRAPPLARSVLSAQIKDTLLQWILQGELPPGARIIETRVARQLGTSQAPVREALRDTASAMRHHAREAEAQVLERDRPAAAG